ncbi:unnamed protein product [Lasius platythorax]|uniref:Protein phosphatase 1 regulatory subunit 35 C-terminal domain-containing protein n=1 Tax=Lasius platythorax TaxID=488582 RepID=A0AAV2P5X3_9HYME
MSENTGAISRPKVRFSQFSDNVQNKEIDVEYCQEKTVLRANGPKITSIVSLKKPVRIVDPKKFTSIHNKDVLQCDRNTEISTHSSDIMSENIRRNTFPSNKNVPKIETSKILRNANGIQNIKENYNMLQPDKSPRDNLKDSKESLQQKGKENRDTILKKVVSSKDISKPKRGSSQYIQSVTQTGNGKPSTGNNTQKINTMNSKKSPKMTKSLSAPNIMKKTKNQMFKGTINAKSVTPNVMPCYKITARNKVSPVKKTILRNVSGPKIKTSVGPGVSHKKRNDANERHIVATLDVAAEELARPGYNSIACTINKLKELKQQKIVRDIDHLPSAQKSFVNGKISTALDFPLDEAIYKNLVDLSIDEKQLPSTITRSKDPEPRQKDITPKLSDFFIPESTKEICEAVHVKPRAPKMDENWNAFKISDKILEWKHSMDDV